MSVVISSVVDSKMHRRFDVIDAFRGVAAFAVLVYHARVILGYGGSEAWATVRQAYDPSGLFWLALTPFGIGGFGVDLFFVLSGYCIHSSMARHLATGAASWRSFFWRRFLRIYPAYLAALVISWLLTVSYSGIGARADCSLLTLLGNLFTLQGFAVPVAARNGALWTLSIEIHLYLFYPVIFIITRRYGVFITALAALAATIVTLVIVETTEMRGYLKHWHAGGPFFTTYLFTWVTGCVVAEVLRNKMKEPVWLSPAAGLFAVATAAALCILGRGSWSAPLIGVCIGALLLAVLRRVDQSGPLPFMAEMARRVGMFSYSLYLVHMPFLFAVGFWFGSDRRSVGIFLFGIFLAMMVAWLLHRWVEIPFMKLRDSALSKVSSRIIEGNTVI